MNGAEARSTLWELGIVSPWYLRRSQLDLYELLLKERYPFIEAARRFGKTNSILAFVIEKLRQNPGWIARWCFPFKNQARDVLVTEVAKLQHDCPSELKFNYQTTDSVFVGPGNSKLYIRGVNEDRGESARGPASNIIVADEYGFWNEPKYIIQSVLFPQLENQEGRWLIKASTPPPNLGHLYYAEREIAARKGRFVRKTIYDNEALSKEELQEIIDECGGTNSISFRRERLCEDVGDPELLVVPEYNDLENTVDDDYPRPDFFSPYVAGDSGADDNTAILFGYYDFAKDEDVVEAEIVINGATTGKITKIAKLMELNLWHNEAIDFHGMLKTIETQETQIIVDRLHLDLSKKPKKRVYDSDKQLIFDLYGDYKYGMQMAEKADKRAAIHDFRLRIGARKFKIKRRCESLRNQLKVGMWKDERKTDFERTEGLGHLDAVAAGIYFNRSIDRSFNPYPSNYGLRRETHFIHSELANSQSSSEKALGSLFGNKARGHK